MNTFSRFIRRAVTGAVDGRRKSLIRDRSGAAAVTIAISFTGVAGLAGLGTEAANWYLTERAIQGATDAAAHTGATALMEGTTSAAAKTEAKSVAANFGFSSSSGATVTVNNPPASGSHTGDNSAVEAIISQPQTLMLSGMFMSSAPTIQARSVALKPTTGANAYPPCVMSLDTNSETSLGTSGSPALTLNGCSVYVNSAGTGALTMGGGTITASAAYVTGTVSGTGLTATNGTKTGVNPHPDPYKNVSVPSPSSSDSACNYSGKLHLTGNGNSVSYTVNPPSLCGGIYGFSDDVTLDSSSTLNLCPGIYVMDGAKTLTIGAQSTLNAPPTASTTPPMSSTLCPGNTTGGVTIVLKNSTPGGSPFQVSTGGGATINVTAPTTGSTAGLAFFQDRVTCTGNGNSGNGCANSLTGQGTQNIQGAMYFPNNSLTYNGGATSGTSQAVCTQLIAYKITFQGTSKLSSSCDSAGTATINVTASQLVE